MDNYQWLFSALGTTCLHSIWKVGLIGLVWYVGVEYLNKSNAQIQYRLSLLTLFATFVIVGHSFYVEMRGLGASAQKYAQEAVETQSYLEKEIDGASEIFPAQTTSVFTRPFFIQNTIPLTAKNNYLLNIIAWFWMIGVVLLTLRFLWQWKKMQGLRYRQVALFNPEQLEQFEKLKTKIGLKQSVTFLQSALVPSPLTFGYFKPIILLPMGMINGFPPSQIEALVLHELAHIKRNDFLVNTLQVWLAILLFYHPVVWLVNKKINNLREELSDDMVVGAGQDKMAYATSLINAQRFFSKQKIQLVMNASDKKSDLSKRIHRIFENDRSSYSNKKNINTYLFGLLMIAVISGYAFSTFSNPTVSVAVDNMNILYTGIENPITVAVAGVSSDAIVLRSEDLLVEEKGNGHYVLIAKKVGKAKLIVRSNEIEEVLIFKVKAIADPIASITNLTGGTITADRLNGTKGLDLSMGDFEHNVQCELTGFELVLVPKKQDPKSRVNHTANFDEQTKQLLGVAKAGDIVYIENVTCNCPGDIADRKINSMVFRIK